MPDREKVIKGLGCCSAMSGDECRRCPYSSECLDEYFPVGMSHLANDALELLKEQEQEISRLKHHVDCDTAEKLLSGCVGYGRGLNDDEPCETCKACEKYNGYGEE